MKFSSVTGLLLSVVSLIFVSGDRGYCDTIGIVADSPAVLSIDFIKNENVLSSWRALSLAVENCNGSSAFEEVKDGVERQFARYNLHEFVYKVRRKNPQGEFEERINTYRLYLPQTGYPIQCLIEKIPDEDEYPIDRFVAFDGRQFTLFSSGDFLKGNWSTARIVAFNTPDDFLSDAFVHILVTSAVGLPFTLMNVHEQNVFWEEKRDMFRFDSTQTLGGHDVIVFSGERHGYEYRLRVLTPPNTMIVGMKATEIESGLVHQDVEIEEVGIFGDLFFPKRGRVYQTLAFSISDDDKFKGVEYHFDVLEVKRLEQFSQTLWIPEIPPGTNVTNDIMGRTTTIPFSDRQKERIIAQLESSAEDFLRRPVWDTYLIIALLLTGICLIAYSIWRLIMKHRQ